MVEKIQPHVHNGSDCPKIPGASIVNAPQGALTQASGLVLSSGGTEDLKTNDATIINNLIIRVGELETKLRNLNLLK